MVSSAGGDAREETNRTIRPRRQGLFVLGRFCLALPVYYPCQWENLDRRPAAACEQPTNVDRTHGAESGDEIVREQGAGLVLLIFTLVYLENFGDFVLLQPAAVPRLPHALNKLLFINALRSFPGHGAILAEFGCVIVGHVGLDF